MGTGGQGELWEKAVRLGYELDPTNPRYADGRMEDVGEDRTMPGADEEATVQMPAFESNPRDDLDFNLDFDSGPSGSGSSTDLDLNQLGDELASSSTTTTDIDLGLLGDAAEGDEVFDPTQTMRTEVKSGDEGAQETSEMEAFDPTAALAPPDTGDLPTLPGIGMADEGKKAADEGLDFELGGDDTTSGEGVSGTIDDVGFDLDTLKLDSPPLGDTGDGHEESSAGAAAGAGTGELAVPDFDLSTDLEADATRPGTGTSTDLDLSTISLELGDDDSPTIVPTGNKDEKWYDVQTKFDLAKAYQEMGDKEGAREILEEVIAEGDDEQKGAAQGLLAELG
ncbi:MAG: hypothetical protein GC151_05225 [Betaproteobacteria bacterium]|nr:hypothetical protein [Betaproteobacteria bacterium]